MISAGGRTGSFSFDAFHQFQPVSMNLSLNVTGPTALSYGNEGHLPPSLSGAASRHRRHRNSLVAEMGGGGGGGEGGETGGGGRVIPKRNESFPAVPPRVGTRSAVSPPRDPPPCTPPHPPAAIYLKSAINWEPDRVRKEKKETL